MDIYPLIENLFLLDPEAIEAFPSRVQSLGLRTLVKTH